MIKTNSKEVQYARKAIKFPSLLNWIEMKKYGSIREATFTSKKTPTMENYIVFSSNQSNTSNSLPPEEIF